MEIKNGYTALEDLCRDTLKDIKVLKEQALYSFGKLHEMRDALDTKTKVS